MGRRVSIIATILFACAIFLPTTDCVAPSLLHLVFQGCSATAFPPNGEFEQTLTALFNTLILHASQGHFYKTTAGSGAYSIYGVFQCRGDLGSGDCYYCVNRLPVEARRGCGRVTAARVQLQGCYLQYNAGDPNSLSGTTRLYSKCGTTPATGAAFLQLRQAAFSDVQVGVQGGRGFYAVGHGGVYTLGQCQGDLSVADCGDCLKTALQEVADHCGTVNSGQVYLTRCYATYAYYPVGGSGAYGSYGMVGGSPEHGQQTGKIIAIVVGGVAALLFVFVCLWFVKSLTKKHDDY
ncbi:plasmodesmata-located protein 2 [Nymphaea colorata]|nr:plasmodesmata-located protein 2 [Nymphaea colorata]